MEAVVGRKTAALLRHPTVLARHLRAAVTLRRGTGLRLHLGCGGRRFPGYVNVDINPTPAVDYVGSIVDLPCGPGTVDRIETFHAVEHLPHRDLPEALRSWQRALAPGGTLVIECPDFDEAVREYLAGDDARLYNIFGLQRFEGDAHLFGYNPRRLTALLEEAGFSAVVETRATDYHTAEEPCMRLEATK